MFCLFTNRDSIYEIKICLTHIEGILLTEVLSSFFANVYEPNSNSGITTAGLYIGPLGNVRVKSSNLGLLC